MELSDRTSEEKFFRLARVNDRAPEVGILDYRIGLRGGTTTALDTTRGQIQLMKKPPPNDKERVEELTRHNGSLRAEIQYYRDCYRYARNFQQSVGNISQELQVAYYQESISNSDALEQFHDLNMKLRQSIELFATHLTRAEENWLQFWHIEGLEPPYTGQI